MAVFLRFCFFHDLNLRPFIWHTMLCFARRSVPFKRTIQQTAYYCSGFSFARKVQVGVNVGSGGEIAVTQPELNPSQGDKPVFQEMVCHLSLPKHKVKQIAEI